MHGGMPGPAGLRITHVVRQYPPGIGGMENFVRALAERQAAAGHRVRVVTLNRIFDGPTTTLPPVDLRGGVEIRRVGFVGGIRYPLAPGILRQLGRPDMVHVHGIEFAADYLSWTRWLHRSTMVVSTHGGFFHTQFAHTIKRLWFNTLTILAAQLIAISTIVNVVAGLPKYVGCLLGGLVITTYFMAGGLLSSVGVNVVQLTVKFVGFGVALPLALSAAGGLEAGWQVRLSTYEMPPVARANDTALDRIELRFPGALLAYLRSLADGPEESSDERPVE